MKMSTVTSLDWKALAKLAKESSPYFREFYKNVSAFNSLSDLPIIDQADYWSANTPKNNQVFTADSVAGIAFKSGGTTDNPKFSVYSREEWDAFCSVFGTGMNKAGLKASDRIANLFYVGELYASFIFIMKCVELAPVGALQFPISGSTKPEIILRTMQEFEINLLAGLPTTLMNVAEFYAEHKADYPSIGVNKIMFGGESMYPDQRKRLEQIFPGVEIRSIGYASVDAGLIGYSDETCGPDEHRCFGSATILEIVDEDTLEPISEMDKPGKIVLTNLIRSYMPIIRYPVGDRAIWKEAANSDNQDRKYQILGRSEEAARVGPVSVYFEDMRSVLLAMDLPFHVSAFQLLISHDELKDLLTLRLATKSRPENYQQFERQIADRFGKERKMFADAMNDQKIHPLKIEWVDQADLDINPRTGKLRRVIDRRNA